MGRSPTHSPFAFRRKAKGEVFRGAHIRIITIMTGAKTIFDIKSEQVTFDRIDRGFKGEYLLA